MPVSVKLSIFNKDEDETLICFMCQEKLHHGERHHHWEIGSEKFVLCSFHRVPTKKLVGLTVLYAFGYLETEVGTATYRVNQVDRRGKILNPASPSYLTLDQICQLYENPSREFTSELINNTLHKNRYWMDKAEDEVKVSSVEQGTDGIRRGTRVLGLDRHCSNCGVPEADMVAKNPKYTLCRGVCVVCYRKLYRKAKVNGTSN